VSVPAEDAPRTAVFEAAERQRRDLLRIDLATDIRTCRRCDGLNEPGTESAPAYGDSMSPVAIVGQSLCGPPCIKSQVPFTGGAGLLLDRAFVRAGITKSQILITNVVHCHPPANRPSLPDEIANCAPFLDRELAVVDPKLVIGLGKDAENWLLRWSTNHRDRWSQDRPWTTGAPLARTLLLERHPSWVKRHRAAVQDAYVTELADAIAWAFAGKPR